MNDRAPHPITFSNRLVKLLPGVYYTLHFTTQWEVWNVSQQTESLLGYTPEEVCAHSKTFLETVIYREDLAMVYARKRQSTEVEELHLLEYRIITKTGEIKYVRDQYTSYEEEGLLIIEGYISEIHPSRLHHRLLHQLKAYRNAVDVNMISSITDKRGKIVYANENFCRISGYSMWELIGRNHRIVNSGYHSHDFFEGLWKTISGGQLWHGEILNRAKNGIDYWVDTVIIPIFDERREIVNYLSLRMPINERKEAEENRKNYTLLLEQIASIVAHNVRGPLCRILGLTNLLLHYKNTAEESETAVRYIHEAATELNDITKSLSLFIHEHEVDDKK